MTQEHTPTPRLVLNIDKPTQYDGKFTSVSFEGEPENFLVNEYLTDDAEIARLSFIVLACNAHDGLVQALEDIAKGMSRDDCAETAFEALEGAKARGQE